MFDFLQATPTLLLSLVGFALTISFLVAIHEYGHFWVARKFGVKIEKFSIGFGKPIVKWYGKRDNTEYSIAWIPLGGYVKMYGENPEADSTETSDNHLTNNHDISDITHVGEGGSFSALPPFKRFLIAFAGPAVNLIFAVLALWFLFVLGVPDLKPYVGSVKADSVFAKASLQRGVQLVAVEGNQTQTLTDATLQLVNYLGSDKVALTTKADNGSEKTRYADLSGLPVGSELDIEKALGFQWEVMQVADSLPAVINQVVSGSPADKAGLKTGDVVRQANATPIKYWHDLVRIIHQNPQKTLQLQVQRGRQLQTLALTPALSPKQAHTGYAGITPVVPEDLYAKYQMVKRFGWWESLPMAIRGNYLQAKLTLKTLGRIISGQASIKNMGGPLTIADYSGKTLKMGYVAYLKFLAVISLTLAVMNLLPIPVLDGGHMALYTLEILRGKPVSEQTAQLLLRIGMSVMLTFMLMVISVDLWKYLLS